MLDAYQTATLVENNVLYTLNNFIMTAGGAAGNVVGYNYMADSRFDDCEQRTDGCWMTEGPAMNHGPHPHMNLWEGNVGNQLGADFIHGSSSHNTIFRSVSTGWQPPRLTTQQPWNSSAVDLEYKNVFMNYVGNVLGTSGHTTTHELDYPATSNPSALTVWRFGYGAPDPRASPFDALGATRPKSTAIRHGNWDAYSAGGTAACADAPGNAVNGIVWDPTISVHELPASLYLSSKPPWFGSALWPPIGPDVPGFHSPIPAETRYRPAP